MNNEEFILRVQKARSRVAAMDAMDGAKDRELKTILAAIVWGIKNPQTEAAFEAVVMLEDLTNTKVA